MNKINLKGQRFGRLKVTHRLAGTPAKYLCKCDCGLTRRVLGCNLTRGNTRSCGCLRKDLGKLRRADPTEKRINDMGRYYRRNAKTRGIVWNLSMAEFKILVMKPCAYCNDSQVPVGVDRKVSKLGYTCKNCSPCCKWCNQAKSNRTVKQFKDWARRLYAGLVLC